MGLFDVFKRIVGRFTAPPASTKTVQAEPPPQAVGSTSPTASSTRTNDPAAARALAAVSSQWVDNSAPRDIDGKGTGADSTADTGSGALRSVAPLGAPYADPAPPRYGFPSRPVVDHVHNRARGGHPTDPRNLDTKTWEANSRKAGFEGNYARDLQRYVLMGLPFEKAVDVLRPEVEYIETDVHARPIDPAALDRLPNQPHDDDTESTD